MDKSPKSANSIEDDEESDEFLCAVAAESVNDAILLLGELKSGTSSAMPLLEQAFALLSEEAHIVSDNPGNAEAPETSEVAPRTELSPTAIDLIVDRRLREREAQAKGLDKKKHLRPKDQSAASAQARQQAVLFMVQALGLLDSDDDATVHLQLAIDRALDRQQDLTSPSRDKHAQRPH